MGAALVPENAIPANKATPTHIPLSLPGMTEDDGACGAEGTDAVAIDHPNVGAGGD